MDIGSLVKLVTRARVEGKVMKRIEKLQFYHKKSMHMKTLVLSFEANTLRIIDGQVNWKGDV